MPGAGKLPVVSLESGLIAGVLFTSSALAVAGFVVTRRQSKIPGRGTMAVLMLAIAHWCLTSGLHAVIASLPTRVAVSKVQYLAVATVPALWLLFASEYARPRWLGDRVLRIALWVVPAITIVLAFTNEAHGLIWSDIVPVGGTGAGRVRYVHGAFFWVSLAFNYACLAIGTIAILRALNRSPLPSRARMALVMAGVALPWASNVLYVSRLLPPGIDPTPVAFALSAACLLLALSQHRLLTLVPIARDLVVESLDAGVLVLDPHGAIVDINPAARRIADCSDESLGSRVDTVVPWWHQANAAGRLAAGAPVVVEVGRTSLEVQVTPVHDSLGARAGSVVFVRDVAERRAAEAERHALERRVQEKLRIESLGVLTAGVAHDFNNLLTGILGHAELVGMEAPAHSTIRSNADAIVRSAQRAADLVDKMLAYAGLRQSAPEAVNLETLVREMGGLMQATIGRDCTIRYESDGALAPVMGDPAQLRQLLLNLVTNAAEAGPPAGTVTIRTGMDHVTEAARAAMTFDGDLAPGPAAYLEVVDDGCGIDAATLHRIFDPFFSTKADGRGLGLAAVQGIVRSHGGGIRIVSQPAKGTQVRVWLPVLTPDALS